MNAEEKILSKLVFDSIKTYSEQLSVLKELACRIVASLGPDAVTRVADMTDAAWSKLVQSQLDNLLNDQLNAVKQTVVTRQPSR